MRNPPIPKHCCAELASYAHDFEGTDLFLFMDEVRRLAHQRARKTNRENEEEILDIITHADAQGHLCVAIRPLPKNPHGPRTFYVVESLMPHESKALGFSEKQGRDKFARFQPHKPSGVIHWMRDNGSWADYDPENIDREFVQLAKLGVLVTIDGYYAIVEKRKQYRLRRMEPASIPLSHLLHPTVQILASHP